MENITNSSLQIDEAMMTIEEMVNELLEPIETIVDDDNGVSMGIEKIEIDMPVQLDVVVDENGKVQIGTTPPLYKIETSFMPVFHQLRFSFESQ
jgi:hypothetical protein